MIKSDGKKHRQTMLFKCARCGSMVKPEDCKDVPIATKKTGRMGYVIVKTITERVCKDCR